MGKDICKDPTCAKICDLKEKIVDHLCAEVSMCGLESCDPQVMGEITDMIKDLTESEKNIHEAKYYEECMEYFDDSFMHIQNKPYRPSQERRDISEYQRKMKDTGRRDRMDRDGWDRDIQHADMTQHHEEPMTSEERFDRMMTDAKSAWKSATPELRKRMKSDLTRLIGEMTV